MTHHTTESTGQTRSSTLAIDQDDNVENVGLSACHKGTVAGDGDELGAEDL